MKNSPELVSIPHGAIDEPPDHDEPAVDSNVSPSNVHTPVAVAIPAMLPLYPILHTQSLAASEPEGLVLAAGQAVQEVAVLFSPLNLPALQGPHDDPPP